MRYVTIFIDQTSQNELKKVMGIFVVLILENKRLSEHCSDWTILEYKYKSFKTVRPVL